MHTPGSTNSRPIQMFHDRFGAHLAADDQVEQATSGILRYKQVLHASDPAHGIFWKAWGNRVADAFMHLETRDHPALNLDR